MVSSTGKVQPALVDKRKLLLPAFGIAVGISLAYVMDPGGEGAKLAMRMLVSIFSITGGVVLGTIVLLGDPALLLPGSARLSYWQIESVKGRLSGLAALFISYILALVLIIVSSLLSDVEPRLAAFLMRGALMVSIAALVCSLYTPFAYIAIQEHRLQKELETRRERDRQKDAAEAIIETSPFKSGVKC